MSKILRRPMFRGGMPVDSRGTGITSGLMDRPGFKFGNTYTNLTDLRQVLPYNMTGQEIMDKYNVTFPINPKSLFIAENPQAQNIEETSEGDIFFTGGKPEFKKDTTYFPGQGDTQGDIDESLNKVQVKLDEKGKPVKDALGNTVYVGSQKPILPKIEGPTGNETIEPEVSAEDAIRENAELFKELLGEASEEDIKKARISDASDYALKLFEETIGKGKGLKEAAGAVAGFATSKDSRVDKAREAAKKTDQTAIALSINDYIAGKRSKEEIAKMFAGLKLKAEYAKGSLGEAFADFRQKQGTLGAKDMEVIIKGRVRGAETEIIPKGSGEYKPNPDGSDEGKFYIEEETKDVYRVVGGKKVKVF